jgi:hypothetical protein
MPMLETGFWMFDAEILHWLTVVRRRRVLAPHLCFHLQARLLRSRRAGSNPELSRSLPSRQSAQTRRSTAQKDDFVEVEQFQHR